MNISNEAKKNAQYGNRTQIRGLRSNTFPFKLIGPTIRKLILLKRFHTLRFSERNVITSCRPS